MTENNRTWDPQTETWVDHAPRSAGYTQPFQPVTVNVQSGREKKRVRHGLHLFLSIITGGLWLPVWLIIAVSA